MTGAEDTAEFARRLRELKDRSGRSYGMLAKRLHMSTSTLHRYCNGDAVPAEYAPVERFARVCGASTEELVSLHRAWVLADAARRRPAPAPAPGSAAAAGAAGAAGASGAAGEAGAAAEAAPASSPPGAVSATEADRANGTPAANAPATGAPAATAAATGAPGAGTPMPHDAPAPDSQASDAGTPDTPTPGAPANTPADTPGAGTTHAHSPAAAQARTAAAAAAPPKTGAGAGAKTAGPEAGTGTGAGAVAGATPEPGTRAPHSPARRRLLVGSAVAAVAAVVLTGTLIARHGADDDHAKDRTAAAGAAASDKDPAPTPVSSEDTASPSPSPSVSASKAKEDEPEAPTPLPEASAAPQVTGTPLTVSTRPFVWEDPCSQHYLVNRPPAEMGPPPTEPDAPGWVAAMGAVSARDQMVALTFQAKGDRTVVLDAIHVRVLRSSAPLPWNDYAMGVGCGGNVATKSFDVRLDDPRPAARPQGGQGAFPYKVSAAEPLVVYVTAHASAHDVSWALDLEWSSGGRSGTVRVDDHGRPFRTSGSTGRPRYEYPLGATAWNRPLA